MGIKRTIGIIGALLAVAAGGVPGGARAAEATPVIYAHRGGAAEAPENTLGAFRQSWDRYGDEGVWLELDVQLTSDGHLVVIHDATLDRTTDCIGNVITKTLAELATCDAATGFREAGHAWDPFEKIPTLAEVLEEGRAPGAGWRLMPELKNVPPEPGFDPTGAEMAQAFAAAVTSAAYPLDHLQVQSFWPPSIDWIGVLLPDVDTALLTTATLPGAPSGAGFTVAENVAYATARGHEIVAPDEASIDLSAASVAAAHAAGRHVVPWTVDDAARIAEIAGYGVDGIITNAPGAAYAALAPPGG